MPLHALSREEKLDWLRLARCGGIGAIRFHKLVGRLGSAGAALRALPGMIAAGTATDVEICPRDRALRELEAIEELGAILLAGCEPDYPAALREIADPPPVLTVLGQVEALAGPAVGVVGARNASGNGRLFAKALAAELGVGGLAVVSGLARGIDTAAHAGAVEAGAITVGVIASGVDTPYPPENAGLAIRIAERGAMISERPLGAAPQARHFPRRNRIISGLSLGVVVVEAAPGSGSLITARLAAEQGREVMAVPGTPLDPRHKGTNQLLRDGATLIESAADVLEALRPVLNGQRPSPRQSTLELPAAVVSRRPAEPAVGLASRLVERLGPEPLGIDELVRQCDATVADVQDALVDLELAGRLERHPGNRVALRLD
jgi:DNA processing protein